MTEALKATKKPQKKIGDYILGSKLGTGGFAKVVEGIHILTGEKVAIKILNMEKLKKDDKENVTKVKKEIEILKIVKHKNIIKLYDVINTTKKIYLVMELCEGGELFDQIDSKHNLTELESLKYFQEYIDALDYLHSQKIVHRDLKPENMLLDNNYSIKLIDFGISNRYTSFLSTPCGTTSYAPPEMHEGSRYCGMLSDVWSGGIVLFTMVCGYLPFFDEDEDRHVRNILRGKFKIPGHINPLLQDLIHHCLQVNPIERYSISQIKKHPWFNMVTPILRPGIISGIHTIPIDERLLDIAKTYMSTKEEIRKNVLNNKYNSITALYYILLKKKQREGYSSISDLISDEYVDFISNQHRNGVQQNNSNSIDNSNNNSINEKSTTVNNHNQYQCQYQFPLSYSKKAVESLQCNNTPSTSFLEQNITPNKENKSNDNNCNNNNSNNCNNNYINYVKQKETINSTINQKKCQKNLAKKINNRTQEEYQIVKTAKANLPSHHQRCHSENAQNYSISPAKYQNSIKIQYEKPNKLAAVRLNDKEIKLQQRKNNIFNNNRKLKRKPIQLMSNRINQSISIPISSNSKRNNSFDSNPQEVIMGLNKQLVLETDNKSNNNNNKRNQSTSKNKNKLSHSTVLSANIKPCSNNISTTITKPATITTANDTQQYKDQTVVKSTNHKSLLDKKHKRDNKLFESQSNKNKVPKEYKGFVDLRCVSFDNIDNIMNKIMTFFNAKQITYANVAPFKYHCSKYGEIFDLEVSSLLNSSIGGNSNSNKVYYISLLSKQCNTNNPNGLINQLFPL